jgi:hypothetical protein
MFYIIAILAAIFAMPVKADETLKFRSIYHATSVQSQDVGDVDGHTLSVVRISGLASFPDGSVAPTQRLAGRSPLHCNSIFGP